MVLSLKYFLYNSNGKLCKKLACKLKSLLHSEINISDSINRLILKNN